MEAHPEVSGFQNDLAGIYNVIGIVYREDRQYDKAREASRLMMWRAAFALAPWAGAKPGRLMTDSLRIWCAKIKSTSWSTFHCTLAPAG